MLNIFFFHVVFINEMKKVNIFSKRLKKLKERVKYLRFFSIYDFKTESLYLINKILSFFLLT